MNDAPWMGLSGLRELVKHLLQKSAALGWEKAGLKGFEPLTHRCLL
jgi:hypothetical protein